MNFKRSALEHKNKPHPPTETVHHADASEIPAVPFWMKLIIVVFAVTVFGGGVTMYVLGSNLYGFIQAARQDPVAAMLDFAGTEPKQDENGRTNILLLGSGGKEYDGGSDLTDSIILVSIDHPSQRVTIVSLPRDLVVKVPEYKEYRRINELFALGRKRLGEGQKDTLIQDAIQQVTCQPVHYFMKIDFSGFEQIIDALGGIDVTVDRQFTDYRYPTVNYGIQTIHFDQGPLHLDGATALQFARSRHGTNGEASDFARAARQHKIIESVWKKVQDMNILNDPARIQTIVQTVNEHYGTDLRVKEMLSIASVAKKILSSKTEVDKDDVVSTPTAPSNLPVVQTSASSGLFAEKVTNIVLNDGPDGLLYAPTTEIRAQYYGGAFVLLPDGDNFDTICSFINRMMRDPTEKGKGPAIEVLNGTARGFLARDVGAVLVKNGYNVTRRDNTFNKRIYDKTYIYDHSRGGNIAVIMELQKMLGGEVVAENTEPVFFSKIGITVVLGNDFVFPEGSLGEPTFDSEGRADTGISGFVNPVTAVIPE